MIMMRVLRGESRLISHVRFSIGVNTIKERGIAINRNNNNQEDIKDDGRATQLSRERAQLFSGEKKEKFSL